MGCKDKAENENDIVPTDSLSKQTAILIFSKTAGYRHHSIANGKTAFENIAKKLGHHAIFSEDASFFNSDSLKNIKAVVFLNTTGDVLSSTEQAAFENYINAGGGFMGVHSATDTEYDWPFYGKLIGAYFNGHPAIQKADLAVVDNNHIATMHYAPTFSKTDEWYNFKNMEPTIHPLILLDEGSYMGGNHGEFHPVAWIQDFGTNRSFYTAMGHTPESYNDPDFLLHLEGGLKYVLRN